MKVQRLYDTLLDRKKEEDAAYAEFLAHPTLDNVRKFAEAVRGTFAVALCLQSEIETKRQQ